MKALLTPVRRVALGLVVAASLIGSTPRQVEARGIPDDILCFLILGSGCVALGAACDEIIGWDWMCDGLFDYCLDSAIDLCFH